MTSPELELTDAQVQTEFKDRVYRLTIYKTITGHLKIGDLFLDWVCGGHIRIGRNNHPVMLKVYYAARDDLWNLEEVRSIGLPALRRYMVLDDLANV